MAHRLLAAFLIAMTLGALNLSLTRCSDPVIKSASGLAGERWYRLMLNDQQVGFMHTDGYKHPLGDWVFKSDLRFVLTPGNPVRIEETLIFGAYPPYSLRRAEQWHKRPGVAAGTLIRSSGDGYETARVQRRHKAGSFKSSADTSLSAELNWHAANWAYDMGEYLAFESWLLGNQPQPGATRVVSTLDFSRGQVVPRVFRVEARNRTGYVVEHASPMDPSSIQLDDAMAPVTMTISGLFELQRVSAEVALAPRTVLQAASYFVPVDRPLPDHQNISALALEIEGQISPGDLWPDLLAEDGRTLRLGANPLSGNNQRRSALQETSAFPISDTRIRVLARRAVGVATRPADQVTALTSFVHDYVEYVEAGNSTHVLALLDDPRGDCSEYADLLTTLARSLDIPSRTVFGLAYADLTPPAFRFHAWNEVFVDGAWRSVDPTWNQLQVDATHIPLPDNTATALRLLTGSGGLSFVVREVRYRDG